MTPGTGSLYRLDPDCARGDVLGGLTISNGIGWSPGDDVMYLVDSGTRSVDAFDFDAAAGTIANRRRLIDVLAAAGLPVSQSTRTAGSGSHSGWLGLTVLPPRRALDAVIELPAELVTSCAFGGDNLDELFVTTASEGITTDAPAPAACRRDLPNPGWLPRQSRASIWRVS